MSDLITGPILTSDLIAGLLGTLRGMIFGLDPVGQIIVWIIFILGVVALLDWLFAVTRLLVQSVSLTRVRHVLNATPDAFPRSPSDAVLNHLGVRARSPLGQRISRVIRLRTSGIGHRDILHELMVDRVESLGSVARYVASAVILLGLLGTVYGLFEAVTGIGTSMRKEFDLEAIRELYTALTSTLGGMATAFGTTLAGLIVAVILMPLNQVLRRFQARVIAVMEDFILCDFLPALEHVDPDASAASTVFANVITEASSRLDTVKDEILKASRTQKESADVLKQASSRMQSGANTFKKGLDRLGEDQQAFTAAINAARTSIESVGTSVAASVRQMENAGTAQTALLEDRLSKLEENEKDLAANALALDELLKEFKGATATLEQEAKTSTEQLIAGFEDSLSRINETASSAQVQAIKEARDALDSLLASNKDELSSLMNEQRDMLLVLRDMLIDVRKSAPTLTSAVPNVTE